MRNRSPTHTPRATPCTCCVCVYLLWYFVFTEKNPALYLLFMRWRHSTVFPVNSVPYIMCVCAHGGYGKTDTCWRYVWTMNVAWKTIWNIVGESVYVKNKYFFFALEIYLSVALSKLNFHVNRKTVRTQTHQKKVNEILKI